MTNAELITIGQRVYQKEWRQKNPEKVRKYHENFWIKRAKKFLAAQEQQKEAKT